MQFFMLAIRSSQEKSLHFYVLLALGYSQHENQNTLKSNEYILNLNESKPNGNS